MLYVKLTNGAVSHLIDIEDEGKQHEVLDLGFYYEVDPDGKPLVVDSRDIVNTRELSVDDRINRIRELYSGKSTINKNTTSLHSRSGNR